MSKKLLREFIPFGGPGSITEGVDGTGKILIRGIIQRANTKNQNNRIYPRELLMREIETYQKAVRENRAVGELDHPSCVTSGYHCLSRRGWLPIEEIKTGDSIATLDTLTNKLVYQDVINKVDEEYSGKMVHIFNKKGTVNQTLTLNHRVMLWDRKNQPYYITANEFMNRNKEKLSHLSHSYMRRAAVYDGNDFDTFDVPGTELTVDATDWAAFLGIWLAEGWASGTKGGMKENKTVAICQKNGTERFFQIRDLLDRMNIEYIIRDSVFLMNYTKTFWQYFYNIGNSYTKYIPQDVKEWSPRLLNVLLEWMLKGDGRNRKGYQKIDEDTQPIVKEYATVSPRLANDVQEIMVKMGYGGTIHTYQPTDRCAPDYDETGRMILEDNSRPINIVYGHVSQTISMDTRFIETELVDYSGRIYCVEVPNSNWLARSPDGNVFWTGNSSTVAFERVSHIIREMSWNGDEVHGVVEILDTPNGQILKTLLRSGVAIGISSRGVGSTSKNESGCDTVQDDFNLVAFDIVSEPSTPGAYLKEGREVDLSLDALPKNDRIYRAANNFLMKRGKK